MTKYTTATQAIDNLFSGVVVDLAGHEKAIFFENVKGCIYCYSPELGIFQHPKSRGEIKAHFSAMLQEGASLYKLEV